MLALVLGVIGAVATWWFGYPGAVVLWLGLVVYAWSVQPGEQTGKDPVTKEPVPQGPREQAHEGPREQAHAQAHARGHQR